MARAKSDNYRMANGLTTQQFRFVIAHFRGLSVPDACAAVGYSSPNHGYNTLNKPHVKAMLSELKAGRMGSAETAILRRDAIEELKAIAFSDVRDMLQPAEIMQADGTVINTFVPADPETWTEQTASAVAKLKFHSADKGGGIAEVQLWSKMDAIKQLGALIGADEQPAELTSPAHATRKLTRADPIKAQDVLAGGKSAVMQDD